MFNILKNIEYYLSLEKFSVNCSDFIGDDNIGFARNCRISDFIDFL